MMEASGSQIPASCFSDLWFPLLCPTSPLHALAFPDSVPSARKDPGVAWGSC